MPDVIEKPEIDVVSAATPRGDEPRVRVLIAAGLLVRHHVAAVAEADDGSVEIRRLDIGRGRSLPMSSRRTDSCT